jgi:hypothetical protein
VQGFMSTKITKTIGNSIWRCRLVLFYVENLRVPFLDTGRKGRRIRCISWDQVREYKNSIRDPRCSTSPSLWLLLEERFKFKWSSWFSAKSYTMRFM